MRSKTNLLKKYALIGMLMFVILACGSRSLSMLEETPLIHVASVSPQPTVIPSATIPATAISTNTYIPIPPDGIVRNVTYCKMGSVSLAMDMYFPQIGGGNWPVLVYVHGGGWIEGNKSDIFESKDVSVFTNAGYLVVSLNYRLAPEYPFPSMIEDIKCAIRHLRAHADRYHLDPNHIGAWGTSAGGHLVSLLGLSDDSAGWDVGQYLGQSSRVQAVANLYGPSDLTTMEPRPHMVDLLFGETTAVRKQLAWASPVNYISADDPPFLLIHGENDALIGVTQSEQFYKLLQSAGIPAQLVIVKNAGHGFSPVGGPISPTRSEIAQIMLAFFDQYLKPAQ